MEKVNLLSKEEQQHVRKEYKRRRLILIELVFLAFLVVSIVELFPLYTHSNLISKEADRRSSAIGQTDESRVQNVDKAFGDIRQKTRRITPSDKRFLITNILPKILDLKTADVRVENISFSEQVTDKNKVSHIIGISGVAATREALLAFGNSLRREAFIKEVDLPVSNFAKERDLEFSLSIILTEQK